MSLATGWCGNLASILKAAYLTRRSATSFSTPSAPRAHGLTVPISVHYADQSGKPTPALLPGPATRRVWSKIAPVFGDDRGAVFEFFNELQPDATAAN